jgi:hypothetical protein
MVMLLFAEQTDRSFFLHGAPCDVMLTDLPDQVELREQKLPDPTHWEMAVQRAGSIFGVAASPLLKASNVIHLATHVQQKATEARSACQAYCHRLQDRLGQLGIAAADTARMQTVVATLTIVEGLHEAAPDQLVGVLATAHVATSASAMGECVSKAMELAGRLDATDWDILEAAARLTDERKTAAEEIRHNLHQALASDEHVISLAVALKEAQAKAVRMLTRSTPLPAAEPKPVPPAGRDVRRHGAEHDLDLRAAKVLIAQLEHELRAGQTLHFNISWTVAEGGAEQ